MEYTINNGRSYLCVDENGSIFSSKVTMKAYRTSNLADICELYRRAEESYFFYDKDKWAVEEWENVLDRYTRYKLHKKMKKSIRISQTMGKGEKKHGRFTFPKETRQVVYENSNKRCAICGRPLQIDFPRQEDYATIDHIVPLNKGGENVLENYQVTCRCCNQIKTDILPEVFSNKFASALAQEIIEDSYKRKIFLMKILRAMCRQSLLAVKAALL